MCLFKARLVTKCIYISGILSIYTLNFYCYYFKKVTSFLYFDLQNRYAIMERHKHSWIKILTYIQENVWWTFYLFVLSSLMKFTSWSWLSSFFIKSEMKKKFVGRAGNSKFCQSFLFYAYPWFIMSYKSRIEMPNLKWEYKCK